jgi:fibronectin type 3 domain-containing protein
MKIWLWLVVALLAFTTPVGSSGLSNITLSWDDNANNESGYKIERAIGTQPYEEIGTVTENVNIFTDSIVLGTQYSYRVRAYNAFGNSAYSNTLLVNKSLSFPHNVLLQLEIK